MYSDEPFTRLLLPVPHQSPMNALLHELAVLGVAEKRGESLSQ
jgi:hypothetical protein